MYARFCIVPLESSMNTGAYSRSKRRTDIRPGPVLQDIRLGGTEYGATRGSGLSLVRKKANRWDRRKGSRCPRRAVSQREPRRRQNACPAEASIAGHAVRMLSGWHAQARQWRAPACRGATPQICHRRQFGQLGSAGWPGPVMHAWNNSTSSASIRVLLSRSAFAQPGWVVPAAPVRQAWR
jgi:hypothetical protein